MNKEIQKRTGRVIARFSCGAASAVATKLAIKKYGNAVEVYYNDTRSEHPDNARFLADCEKWLGVKVNVLRSDKYSDIWHVFLERRFLRSPNGAPCTSELKRIPGQSIWQFGDVEVFGYKADEEDRVQMFRANNTERIIECPLIDAHLTKADCLGMLERAGIALPVMYSLGFRNNNCIGCVKAQSIDYWKRVRKHFPEVFQRMAKIERELGYSINRVTVKGKTQRVYLDEIKPGEPIGRDPEISCGLFCHAESEAKSE